MRVTRAKFGIIGIVLAAPLLLAAITAGAPRATLLPWPYFSPDEPEAPPVRTPAEALKTFSMPPGYRLELVASEPLVQDPILMEFDGDGRLWVVELPGWAHNESMDNSFDPVNRLVVLEDTNEDGVFDKRTVFLDKLVMPRAFKILANGCALVGEPPMLWKACDTDGDLVSDTKAPVADDFSRLGVLEHGANGLFWSMENRLIVSEHEWDLAYDKGRFTRVPGLRRGQWGVTQDDGGRVYRNVNTDPLFVDYVAPSYYTRNPDMVRTSGLYTSLVDQEKTNIWPAHPTLGLNRGYRRSVFRDDDTASYYGGVSSPLIYRGSTLPAELHGQALVADGATNIVHLLRVMDDGKGKLSAEDFYPKGEFLASTDVRFRPTALATGWDGAIYIADMYRGVSQDGPLQTDYLKDYIGKRGLAKGTGMGRIYRVVHDGMKPPARPTLTKAGSAELVATLSNPDGWWRDTAQQLLVQRADPASVPMLRKLVRSDADWRARLQALWTLDGMGAGTPDLVTLALGDREANIRVAGLRLAEPALGAGDAKITKAVLALGGDESWFVRRQMAATLGAMPADARLAPMLALLRAHGDDLIVADAAVSGLRGEEVRVLSALAQDPAPPAEAIVGLASAVAKRRDADTGGAVVAMAENPQLAASTRSALLDGLAMGLTGGAAQAGNSVAGGRAGGGIPGVSSRRGGASEQLALAAEPTTLAALAKGEGALAPAAGKVLALVTWPGRPAPPALPPRSASEEALFVQGRTLYVDNCSGCHQLSGQGMPQVGAPLAGSKRATASFDIPVRILTNGLEGKLGLMPPLGADMSDDDLAAILTYVRQSWGNTGTPVPPAAVKEWRLAFAHRTDPWSEDELAKPIK